ncbi:hypothetical protein CBW24_05605 [Pacificitalea manganoxidans]|uniref:DUF2948 family protein n=1 Tax=Pacificitalea manganoxidans TaxID=1411902 RepID=A0A291LXQ7_9RHOB|nr:DUF2948 family protein [Pacificitalea manganoxidans]ATI41526.1 hypothetical protein CBW24_05605 [Pacificitalea manganoxidans]MDR6308949.1 hypothetical protein [Pacificitalea manganoxidans]
MTDATFQDGAETPLYLKALDAGAVPLLSAYAQDAVFPISEMRFDKMDRHFALLINRFRWEDRAAAEAQGRPYERVRAVLMIGDVMRVATSGIDRSDKDLVLSLLDIAFEPGADGTGTLLLTLAGDGAIRLEVECLDLLLRDVERPYAAPSGKVPSHPVTEDGSAG